MHPSDTIFKAVTTALLFAFEKPSVHDSSQNVVAHKRWDAEAMRRSMSAAGELTDCSMSARLPVN